MKVLIMPSWYPNKKKYSGSFFKEQAAFLMASGFEVKVLMAEELHTKSYIFQLLKCILTGKWDKLTKGFLEQDPEAYSFPVILQKGWSEQKQISVANTEYLKAFRKLLKSGWMPDIIHVQGANKAGFSAQHIFNKFKVPYVVIEHSPFILDSYSKFRQEKIKAVLMGANKVAGVSNFQKERMLQDGVNRPIDIVWNFIDEDKFRIAYTSKSNDRFIITTITTPAYVKDPTTFFKAISKFRQGVPKNQKLKVFVIGNNALTDFDLNTSYFEEMASLYKVEDVCTFIPKLDREGVVELLQRSNVFISTSLNEPFGIAIREAMLCGIPVISTRSGGPEDSINEHTGILVEIGDYEAIAKSLFDIYNGSLTFDSEYIRNYVISQSGRVTFLKSMTNFYTLAND